MPRDVRSGSLMATLGQARKPRECGKRAGGPRRSTFRLRSCIGRGTQKRYDEQSGTVTDSVIARREIHVLREVLGCRGRRRRPGLTGRVCIECSPRKYKPD